MAESNLLGNSAIYLENSEDAQFLPFPKYTHLPFANRGDNFLCTYFRPILSNSSVTYSSPDSSGNSTDSETNIDHASNVARWLESLPTDRNQDDPESNGIILARKRKLTKNKNLLRVVEKIVEEMEEDKLSASLKNSRKHSRKNSKNSENLQTRKSNDEVASEGDSSELELAKPLFRNPELEKCLDESMRKAVRMYKGGGRAWEDMMKENLKASQEPPFKRTKSRLTPTPSTSSQTPADDGKKCIPWLCIQNYFTS